MCDPATAVQTFVRFAGALVAKLTALLRVISTAG
jgi:hypothetical protein